jgi:hypothetical protein
VTAHIVTTPQQMSEREARACVTRIRSGIEGVRKAVLELHEGEGWRALGHGSWRECVVKEFPNSERHLYRQLEAAQVERRLTHGSKEPVELNERQARELAKLPAEKQPEAWARAVESAPDGKVTAKHVAEVVEELKPRKQPKRGAQQKRRKPRVRMAKCAQCGAAHDYYLDCTTPSCVEKREREHLEWSATSAAKRFENDGPATVARILRELADGLHADELVVRGTDTAEEALLDALREQRDQDSAFRAYMNAQRFVADSAKGREQKMMVFILDGGEHALVRLGLDWTVTPEKLKAAYKREALKVHPDRGGDAGAFHKLTQARDMIAKYLGASA